MIRRGRLVAVLVALAVAIGAWRQWMIARNERQLPSAGPPEEIDAVQ